jgi:hypothetical protein
MRKPNFEPHPDLIKQLSASAPPTETRPEAPPAMPPIPDNLSELTIPVTVPVPAATIHAKMDRDAEGLYNQFVEVYRRSKCHPAVAIYVLELLRAELVEKERARHGIK